MATLKEKFGKFELSKEQVKAVKGGGFCICLNGKFLGERTSKTTANAVLNAAAENLGTTIDEGDGVVPCTNGLIAPGVPACSTGS
jgi:hypothetical protein